MKKALLNLINIDINIFNQLLEELEFNTNIARDDNICVDNDHLYCASDFDCPGEDVCESNSLELRRDLERLGDLISIQNSLYSYLGSTLLQCE